MLHLVKKTAIIILFFRQSGGYFKQRGGSRIRSGVVMSELLLFLNMLMAALLLFAGGYAVYSAIKLKTLYYLFENRYLYPGNCDPKDCKDQYGFIDFIFPRILALGIICLALGVVYALTKFSDVIHLSDWLLDYVVPGLGFAAFIWYVVIQRKAAKRFW